MSHELPSSHQRPSRRAQSPLRPIKRWHLCRRGPLRSHHCQRCPSPSRPLPPGTIHHALLPLGPIESSIPTSHQLPSSCELPTSRDLPSSCQRPSCRAQSPSHPIKGWYHHQHGPLPLRPRASKPKPLRPLLQGSDRCSPLPSRPSRHISLPLRPRAVKPHLRPPL